MMRIKKLYIYIFFNAFFYQRSFCKHLHTIVKTLLEKYFSCSKSHSTCLTYNICRKQFQNKFDFRTHLKKSIILFWVLVKKQLNWETFFIAMKVRKISNGSTSLMVVLKSFLSPVYNRRHLCKPSINLRQPAETVSGQ